MGANYQSMNVASTDKKIVEDAFDDAQSTDRYENGHSYSGGFGMATGLAFMVNEKFTSDDAADEWLEENAQKWGEALAVLVSSDGEPHYRIGATCAC